MPASSLVTGDVASNDSFPRVAKLGSPLAERAATELGAACVQLRESGAPGAASRIEGIDSHVGTIDFGALEKLADPEGAADEIVASRQQRVRFLHTVRNICALAPLVFTWLALGLASVAYSSDLRAHPADSAQPFLFLWQQGFDGRYMTFFDAALVDVVLLALVIGLTCWVHVAEGKAARGQAEVIDDLYSALNTLAAAMEQPVVRPPASAEEWADAARRIITDAMEQTRLLAETSQRAIEEAGTRLSGIQGQGREFIERYSIEIQQTMRSVHEQNEQVIKQTASESRETLRRLVEQQMEPLLKQLSTMLAEFGTHQETYRTGISGLGQSVTSIQASSQELADSAHSYRESADMMNENLAKIARTQQEFNARISGSAASMQAAAAALDESKDVLQGMDEGVRRMSADIVAASRAMDTVQRNLASTTSALSDSAAALNKATRDLGSFRSDGSRRRRWPF